MSMDSKMFCFQCEQTLGGKGCVKHGICGKSPEVAGLQDLLVHMLKGIGFYGEKAIAAGKTIDEDTHKFVMDTIFSTLTNVNFDPERFVSYIRKAKDVKESLKLLAGNIDGDIPKDVLYTPPATKEEMLEDAKAVGVMSNPNMDEDIRSLRELVIYGLKGMGAYGHHAYVLGKMDDTVSNFFYKGLASTLNDSLSVEDMVGMNMELGKANYKCMELLDSANTGTYGHPEPTEVLITKKKGPFIVVSGHDLLDLKQLLEQTEGKGINIYTHGEMLPTHGYPA